MRNFVDFEGDYGIKCACGVRLNPAGILTCSHAKQSKPHLKKGQIAIYVIKHVKGFYPHVNVFICRLIIFL